MFFQFTFCIPTFTSACYFLERDWVGLVFLKRAKNCDHFRLLDKVFPIEFFQIQSHTTHNQCFFNSRFVPLLLLPLVIF